MGARSTTDTNRPTRRISAAVFAIAVAAASGANTAAAQETGPGVGPRERPAGPASSDRDFDPLASIQRVVAETQRRSRVALDLFRFSTVRADAQLNGAANELAACQRRGGSCSVHAESFRRAEIEADEAARGGAMTYRASLVPVIAAYRKELEDNVINDEWVFQQLQRRANEAGVDQLAPLVDMLNRLKKMASQADSITREKAKREIERQERELEELQRQARSYERAFAVDARSGGR